MLSISTTNFASSPLGDMMTDKDRFKNVQDELDVEEYEEQDEEYEDYEDYDEEEEDLVVSNHKRLPSKWRQKQKERTIKLRKARKQKRQRYET